MKRVKLNHTEGKMLQEYKIGCAKREPAKGGKYRGKNGNERGKKKRP